MRVLLVAGLAIASVVGMAGVSSAEPVDIRHTSQPCPYGYREVLNNGGSRYCVKIDLTDVRLTTNGTCPAGYSEYSVADSAGICVRN